MKVRIINNNMKSFLTFSSLILFVIALPIAMFQVTSPEILGALALLHALSLIFTKLPVGFALAIPSLLALYITSGSQAVAGTLRSISYSSVASWSLTVIPLFIFMGLMLWRSGATTQVYRLATSALKGIPGGLAVGTNFAGAGMASVSGDTIGTTYTLGRVGIPEMLKAGYD